MSREGDLPGAGKRRVGEKPVPARRDFVPVQTRRTFEEVCDQVRGQVEAGLLSPGDRLPAERDLAVQLNVSRTAVREALKSLEVAGIVDTLKGGSGGSFIKRGSSLPMAQAMRDMTLLGKIPRNTIMEARIHITAVALRLAAERGTVADFDAMEREIDLTEQLTRTGDLTRRPGYITEFYRTLARASHNEVIGWMLDALSELARALLEKVGPIPRKDVVAVRRRILKHLRSRDAEKAVKEMTQHLKRLDRDIQRKEAAGVDSKPASISRAGRRSTG